MPSRRLSSLTIPLSWRRPLSLVALILMAASLVSNAVLGTSTTSPEPIDYGVFGPPGADILTGHWVGIFRDPIIQAGPFELIFWGVPWLLGVHGVTAWIVFDIVLGVGFSVVLAWLVLRLLRPITVAWSVPIALGVVALAALTGTTTRVLSVGHPAEFVIPLMWVVAAVWARRDCSLAAAALLAATAGWELWGLLGVPVLLLAPRIRWRTVWHSALAGVLVLAVVFLPFVLLGPFHMFSWTWPIEDGSLAHLLFPQERAFPWTLRLAQGVLSIGAGTTVAWFTRRRRDAIWLVPLAICAVRLVTDPVLAGYYAVPSVLLVLICAAVAIVRRSVLVVIVCLLMFNLLIDVPLSVITVGIFLVLVAATVALSARSPAPELA